EIKCDTLLLSCGLIPENELSNALGVGMNRVTGGPLVNESLETDIEGVFACGNVLHVHDLVDYVSEESAQAGKKAAEYLKAKEGKCSCSESGNKEEASIKINAVDGVRYTVPSVIRLSRMEDRQTVRFRVGAVYKKAAIQVLAGDKEIMNLKKAALAPGEMEQVILQKSVLESIPDLEEVTIRVKTD
ncbi:MAG: FAD-dependent oxidoreductase, partial [Lachnospiraceae bacterium]|nr:FAD-dependent oxidoreductase [Lachnospiraceae bacterium]